MKENPDIEHALRHVRQIGGNDAVRDVLCGALAHRATHAKRELRAIAMGCGDDHAASRIETILAEEGKISLH